MSKWREVRLGEVSEVFSGYAFKSNDFLDCGDIPVIKIGNINETGINLKDNIVYVDDIFLQKIDSKYQVKKGDILISLTGSNINQPNSIVGRVGLYRHENISFLNQRAGKIEPKAGYSRDYIFYLYSLKSMTYYVASIAYGGANQVNISPTTIKNIKIKIPDLETQEKIGHVLSTYDELIENNNKRIELLEKMAEEIYKEWFVRMRFPGHEETKFEKGIPEGWEVKHFINNDVKLISSGIDEFDGTKIYLATADVDGINIVGGEEINYTDKPSRANMQPMKRSIWFAKMQDTTKHLYFDKFSNDQINNIVLSTGFAGIEFKNINCYYYYLSFIRYGVFESIKDMYANGSTQVAINNQNIKRLTLIMPTDNLLLEFNSKLEDIYFVINEYKKQNQNLIKQRDMLLPRLMNGTIEVE